MPQPIRKSCEVNLGGGLDSNAEFAMWVGRIVGVSGLLESLLGHLLAYLSDASAPITIAMFHSVISSDAQRAMLTAAAENKLKGAQLLEFRDLMDEFRTRYGERNRIVHNLWGVSPQHPDKLVWCHSKDSSRVSGLMVAATDDQQLDLALPEAQTIYQKCSLYTAKDLADVYDRLAAYTKRVREFILKLQDEHPVLGPRYRTPKPTSAPEIELHPQSAEDDSEMAEGDEAEN